MIENKDRVNVGLRLASMLVDHFAMIFIIMIMIFPVFAISMFSAFNIEHEPSSMNIGIIVFLCVFSYCVYLNKDIFNGRSPAKRILKLQVIDVKTNKVASPLKCLVRNLFILIWPIEVIFVIINPKSRIGDKIAGTRIDYVEQPEKNKIDRKKLIAPVLISLGFSLLISLPFTILSKIIGRDEVQFVQSSYNESESKKLNQIFESELSELLKKADFKVYDKVENDDRRYLSCILYFRNKEDLKNYDQNEHKITALFKNEYSLDKNIYFVKAIYKVSGSVSYSQKYYDSRTTEK